ncbi:hypothetical protein CsSME_00029078 [Camellia sinensis var. sinensis]
MEESAEWRFKYDEEVKKATKCSGIETEKKKFKIMWEVVEFDLANREAMEESAEWRFKYDEEVKKATKCAQELNEMTLMRGLPEIFWCMEKKLYFCKCHFTWYSKCNFCIWRALLFE